MTTTKIRTFEISYKHVTNITKDFTVPESTGNINFENEETCKKIKKGLWWQKSLFWNSLRERCFK